MIKNVHQVLWPSDKTAHIDHGNVPDNISSLSHDYHLQSKPDNASSKKQADQYAMNNDYENELKLWQEAYKKLPKNDEVKVCLISIIIQ